MPDDDAGALAWQEQVAAIATSTRWSTRTSDLGAAVAEGLNLDPQLESIPVNMGAKQVVGGRLRHDHPERRPPDLARAPIGRIPARQGSVRRYCDHMVVPAPAPITPTDTTGPDRPARRTGLLITYGSIIAVAAVLGVLTGQLIYFLIVGIVACGIVWGVGTTVRRSRANRPDTPTEITPTSPDAAGHTNIFAVLALVFGVMGGLAAIPFGHVARHQIRRTGENGQGLATAGLILGYVWLASIVGVGIWFAIVIATQ